MVEHRGRELPWLRIVQFHKEIVGRAEETFFSLSERHHTVDGRWTSLDGFSPQELAGPWTIDAAQISSQPFQLAAGQEEHESVFIGGPCYVAQRKMKDKWQSFWRPLLYREVSLRAVETGFEIIPEQGKWSFSPLLYSLVDRRQIDVEESLDDLADAVIEKATTIRGATTSSLGQAILDALLSVVPDVEGDLTKSLRPSDFSFQPSPWVLFAPTKGFGVFNRHLGADFERLEKLLQKPNPEFGGLHLLDEDRPRAKNPVEVDIFPIVPLNEEQKKAVKTILEEHPVTVISGPPGTGKSQVVVSLLLNAWARGRSVLFASNNNKAVDVVRERIERFESEFPIAVRAGSQKHQNIEEVLRRTLNMAAQTEDSAEKESVDAQRKLRRTRLENQLEQLKKELETKLPQRIHEAYRESWRVYSESRKIAAEVVAREGELSEQQAQLGFAGRDISDIELAIEQTTLWVNRIADFRQLIRDDDQSRTELTAATKNQERLRDRAAEKIGLLSEDAGDWSWLTSGPSAELISNWDQRLRGVLTEAIEETLEPVQWDDLYDRWTSSQKAEEWASQARVLAEDIRRAIAELAPKLESIADLNQRLDEAKKSLQENGIPDDQVLSESALSQWAAAFAEYSTSERRGLDFLPWSRWSRLQRQLRRLEKEMRPFFPLTFWGRIGTLNQEGRTRLAPAVEAALRWTQLQQERAEIHSVIEEIDAVFLELRSRAAGLRVSGIPSGQESEEWETLASTCEKTVLVADAAAIVWNQRDEKEKTETLLRSLVKEWRGLGPGVPIFEAWRSGQGESLHETIIQVGQTPDPQTVAKVRAALYQGALTQLIESWQSASNAEQEAIQSRTALQGVPSNSDRLQEWWVERPETAFVFPAEPSQWPSQEELSARIQEVATWLAEWSSFLGEIRPQQEQRSAELLSQAVGQMERSIHLVTDGSIQEELLKLFKQIHLDPTSEWPVNELAELFSSNSPNRIQSKIDGIQAQLERGSFEDAKDNWLERLRTDDDAVKAVNDLEKAISRNKGRVPESHYDAFRSALRVTQVWITTAQAAQAIPLEPELFDIVVIDEASQCTLTNLLPLLYRGKTLAVIGDEHQLQAIPTIHENEETGLARKHGIEEHLQLIGHATNDVYKTAIEALPRRRAGVVMLNEHYRSHPLIIGFSNWHIYGHRLKLMKTSEGRNSLPFASGVDSVPVLGKAERHEGSWRNRPEAEAVVNKIRELREGDARSLSIGVVTSFRAQKELLIDLLTAANLATGILVDTAHGFQGDERDVMLFSPVVAKGISPGTSRWVESPPNLINVALTRAREALFVVADFDYLKQQDGILRKLALYCDDISLLRETSPAELALFSLLVVDGWQPEVHPVIGDIEVDFVLERSGIRLVIEVDGEEHHKNKEEDKARDAFLRGRGYEVLRIPARDILATPHQVIHDINQVFKIDDTDDIQDDGTDGDPDDADEDDDVDSPDN